MNGETKIVITINDSMTAAAVGIQSTGCDPAFSKVEGDLEMVLTNLPNLVEEARRRWETSPRYPKSRLPPSPPSQNATAGVTHQSAPAKPQLQPRIF